MTQASSTGSSTEPESTNTPSTPSNVVPIGTAPTEPAAPKPPVQAVQAVQAVPEGQAVDCDPAAAEPGEIVQLIVQFPPGTVLKGLVLGEGLEVRTVLVGRMRFPGPDGDRWEACYGKAVPDQAFVILLVQNMNADTAVARATWYVTTGTPGAVIQRTPGPVMPSAAAAALPSQAVASPAAAGANPFQTAPYAGQSQASPAPGSLTSPAVPAYGAAAQQSSQSSLAGLPSVVVPGTNEVVVLLQKSECQRLVEALTPGGAPIDHHHQPSIMRQLLAALAR